MAVAASASVVAAAVPTAVLGSRVEGGAPAAHHAGSKGLETVNPGSGSGVSREFWEGLFAPFKVGRRTVPVSREDEGRSDLHIVAVFMRCGVLCH